MTAALYKADIAIFILFLALIVIIGFKHRTRGTTFREYAVGDKKLDDSILTTTIIATWISGSWLLIDLEETYSRGLVYIIASIVGSIAVLLITGRIIGPRMGKFMHSMSASHALGALYGRPVQVAAGAVLVATSVGYTVLQLAVISRLLEVLFGYGGPEPMLIVGTIIILYAAAGGIKAVTFTDALQFLTFGTLLPVLSLCIRDHMEHAGLVRQLIDTDPRFSLSEIFRSPPDLMQATVLMLYFSFPGLAPQLFQRMVMAQDTVQIKRTMTYAALVCLVVQAIIALIAVLLLADRPGLAPDQLLTYIVERHTYTGLRGLLGVGILAMAMSTADSVLNAGAVIFANDVVAPLQSRTEGTRSVAKWATLGIGLVALSLALHVQHHLLTIVFTSASLYMPIVTIPMLLAIFGFQTSQRIVLMGMGVGLATTSACLHYTQSPYSPFPGMLANLLVTLGAHRWQHSTSGWGHNVTPEDLLLQKRLQRWRQKLTELRQLDPRTYLESILPKHTLRFIAFGSYAFLATGASLLDLSAGARQHYFDLYQLIYSSAFIVTTSCILHPIWPAKLKNHPLLAYVWPIVVFFTLFGLSGMLTIMSGFKRIHSISFVVNTAFAISLMYWPLALLMSATGAVLTAQLFKWSMGVATLPGELDNHSLMAFILTIATLPAWVFTIGDKDKAIAWLQTALMHKDKKQTKLVESALQALETEKRFVRSVTSEGVHTANAVADICQKMLQEPVSVKPEDVKDAGQRAGYIANYLNEAVSRARGYLQLKTTQMKLPRFIQKVQDGLGEWCFGAKDRVKFQVDTQQKILQGDIDKLCQLLWSAICHTCEYAPKERNLIVRVQDTKLDYLLNPTKERTKKVKALRFTITAEEVHWDAKDLYRGCTVQTTTPQMPLETELLITNHQSVVDAHYGTLEWAITEQGPAHAYVIPVRLREVRPQTMEELTARRVPNNVISAQEREFIRTVEEKTNLDPSLLHKALRVIKTYQAGAAKQPGPPPYLRSMAVAQLLLEYNTTDPDVILSTLIKDTVEQTRFSFHQVAIMFNDTVRYLTEKLMNFGNLMNTSKRIQLSDFERTYQLLTETEHRIVYIEVMNCLYNMRNIEQYDSVEEQRQVALHNLRFGVPMARALGLKKVEQEFRKASTIVLNAAMTFDYSD